LYAIGSAGEKGAEYWVGLILLSCDVIVWYGKNWRRINIKIYQLEFNFQTWMNTTDTSKNTMQKLH